MERHIIKRLRELGVVEKQAEKHALDGTTKRCRGCGEVKELASFTPQKLGALGRMSRCKVCRGRDFQWIYRKRVEARAGRVRTDHCEACDAPRSTQKRAMHADHDHKTGEFRGWICQGCNMVLGYLESDPERLRKCERYLAHHKMAAWARGES